MRFTVIALLALIGQDAKELTKDWKHRWADTAVGSSVTFELTSLAMEMGQDGKLTQKEMKSKRVETVSKVDGKSVTIEWGDGDEKHPQSFHIGLPSDCDGTCTKGADEVIKVGEKSYTCSVTEIKKETGKIVQSMKVWKCADAPAWAVKEVWSQTMNGKSQGGWTEELTGTETIKVGGKELVCAIVRRTTVLAGVKQLDTEWRSREIPGGVAKATNQTFMNDKEMKEAGSSRVATAFEKK